MYVKFSRLFLLIVGLGSIFAPGLGYASDLAKEKRWADQIVDSLLVGEAEWLTVNKQKVLSIYTESSTDMTQGGAIVLHGIGIHPNWPEIVHPLRSQLPDHGWATLSVQLPILPNEAEPPEYAPLFDEVAPRLQAAIAFLKAKGIKNIVIVAHSLGAAMATDYLANGKPDRAVRAFVGIGMNQSANPRMDPATSIANIKIPILDIYGSRDLDGVLASAKARRTAAKKSGHPAFQQLKVEGADHFFNGKDDILVKRVRGWLTRNAAGTEIKR